MDRQQIDIALAGKHIDYDAVRQPGNAWMELDFDGEVLCWKILDVAFREDDCRIRISEAAQTFAVLRRIALDRLKNDKTTKLGVANKHLKAGWNVNYLSKLMGLPT